MDKDFEFKVIGIAKALKQDKFKVPPNQREYSWTKDVQVIDFLQDISNALRNPERPYFLGTIVLTVAEDDVLEIADGQQRLATTTMVLAAIRDYFRDNGKTDNYKSIEHDFLFSYARKKGEHSSNLTLNIDDNEFFSKKVLHHNTIKNDSKNDVIRKSHRLIAEAYHTIKKYINGIIELDEKRAGDVLNDWIDYLENKANIVMLKVSNAENAFTMFETLNDRGLKTSQVDLVKNHIFNKAGDRLMEAQKMWSSMKTAIETVSDDDEITLDFLRSACCIISGQTTKKEVMMKVKERTQSKTDALRILSLFEELSQEYAAILNPDHPKWNAYGEDARKSIQVINLLGVTQIRPLMLSISRYFSNRNTPLAFKKLVSWSVRFLILNIRGGRLDEGYAKLANKVYEKKILDEGDLKKEAENIVIKDADFKTAFSTVKVGVSKLARYYLRALEITASNQPDPEFLPNENTVINLEHIMPASAEKEEWGNISIADAGAYLNRLGNLCLLRSKKNSDIGDLPFKEKQKEFKASSYQLTNQLAEIDKWDIPAIENRQKTLAELAVKTWQI